MNHKGIGEIGQNCVIGELSKHCIGVAPILSDNYPFDLIAIAGQKMFKIQVKTSTANKEQEYVVFNISTSNWLKRTSKKYTKEDCDVMILYDLVFNKCFLLSPYNFEGKGSFVIRYKISKNNNKKNINWWEDFIISNERIKKIFDYDIPDIRSQFSLTKSNYLNFCKKCGKEFNGTNSKARYCSIECRNFSKIKIERPSKEELFKMIDDMSYVAIGKKYCVSDNTVRKWIKYYNAKEKLL